MKIVSTNIAKPTTILWNGQNIQTGIYKTPVDEPVYLGKEIVKGDEVSDRHVHGGEFKACYLFSEKHYPYWKNLYPNLDWKWGMFGENLTVSDLDESKIMVGDIYKIGEAIVQVTQPREPCFKFGVKFGTQKVLKQFIDYGYPGTYVRVLHEGFVRVNDSLELIERSRPSLSVKDLFDLLFLKPKNKALLKIAISSKSLPERKRQELSKLL